MGTVGIVLALGCLDAYSGAVHPVTGDPTAGGTQFYGAVDDVRLWGGAVAAEGDIADRALREVEPTETDLELYLQFSEGTGTDAYDSTANSHDATLEGTAQWVGFGGGAELAGRRKKRVWGIRRMVEGVLVDHQRLVYQVNARETLSITPLQGGFASLVSDGDFDNVYDWTPVAGHYATQLSEGLCQFQSDPTAGGTIVLAFDVEGDVDDVDGYTAVGPEIMRNIVREAAVADVDMAATVAAAADRPDAVGVMTGLDPVSIESVLSQIASGHDGWWTMKRDGDFTQGLRGEPGVPEVDLTPDSVKVDSVKLLASPPPVKRWRLSWRPHEVTMDLGAVSGSIDDPAKGQYTKGLRYATSRYALATARRHADAREAAGDTLYDAEVAVRRELARRIAIDELRRESYLVPLQRGLFRHRVGQPVSLYLDAGLNLERGVAREERGYLDFEAFVWPVEVGGYVSVPDPPDVGSGSWTFEGWVRADLDPAGNSSALVGRIDSDDGWDIRVESDVSGVAGRIQFRSRVSGITDIRLSYGHPVLRSAGWVHVAVVVDRTAETVAFVFNGVLDRLEHSYAPGGPLDAPVELMFGLFDGGMSDFRLWDHARTVDEIRSEMNVFVSGTIGNWRLDDVGDVAVDSEFGNNGVIYPNVTRRVRPAEYVTRKFIVGGYDEDGAVERADLYVWGAAWEHEVAT